MIYRGLLALALLLLALPSAISACTCSQEPPGKCPGLQSDDVVFLGTVTDIAAVPPESPAAGAASDDTSGASAQANGSTPIYRFHFHIDERFAGPDTPDIDVFSGGDDGDCGYNFKKGDQYVVFTQPETEGRLFATICSGTRHVADARALIPQLRAMRNHDHVASVFGLLHRANPPLLAPTDDPEDPLPNIKLKLRSRDDRFATSTGPDGVYTFYDVHAGEYQYTADLPARFEFSQKTLKGALPPFKIPNGACYEYNVSALPTGKIRGGVIGPDGKALTLASVELYRSDQYDNSRPGLWGFQGNDGKFEFDHIGAGEYILVFNRLNRQDPNSPFPRTFYPGVREAAETKFIRVKDGQQLLNVNIKLKNGFPTRRVKVLLKWRDGRPAGETTVLARAEQGGNPAVHKIAEGQYEFPALESARYTVSAWEDLDPQRAAPTRRGEPACTIPARINSDTVTVDGADPAATTITLNFTKPNCETQDQGQTLQPHDQEQPPQQTPQPQDNAQPQQDSRPPAQTPPQHKTTRGVSR